MMQIEFQTKNENLFLIITKDHHRFVYPVSQETASQFKIYLNALIIKTLSEFLETECDIELDWNQL